MFLLYRILLPYWWSLRWTKPHICLGHLCKVRDAEGLAVTSFPSSTCLALPPGLLASGGPLLLPRPESHLGKDQAR